MRAMNQLTDRVDDRRLLSATPRLLRIANYHLIHQ
jgi:hypothetical protein